MPAIAVPAFALTWWLGCYLVARDPARILLWRAGGALGSYAVAVAAWTVAPGSGTAMVLLCVPALGWAGVAAALIPRGVPERRPVNLGWAYASGVFLILAVLLPGVGKLVAVAPLAGALALLLRYADRVRPRRLPAAFAAAAALYAAGLVIVLIPIDLGSAELVIATIGLDQLLLGYLVAVADAVEAGERLLPDLRRSLVAAGAATLLFGGPVALTLLAAPGLHTVAVLQFVLVAVVLGAVGTAVPLRAGLDRLAFLQDERLRADRAALMVAADALPRRRERHQMIAMDEDEFHRLTRRALDDYADIGRLLRNPLIDLPTVDRRLHARGPGVADQPLVRVAELRAVLAEHVQKLRPAGGFGTTDEWRFYNALHYCCVLGLRPYERTPRTDGLDRDARRAVDWLRRYVPRKTLRRWTAEGADLVAARLWRDLVTADPRWLSRTAAGVPAPRDADGHRDGPVLDGRRPDPALRRDRTRPRGTARPLDPPDRGARPGGGR
ncbi:hypothetical protein [Pseudosporangium ferrugineum]|uniref:Uncharacterized protein n=1 Tax=Pseudosporangium ferrugineum TaxID=439699 RepID=A0A2T0SD92_9ACTN|nr:hypothetical protein [Pseudosporangium ferrugineum]PRY31351.1 hypothetical protein CLV70_103237 [Pseudosporangium ferrugineum]